MAKPLNPKQTKFVELFLAGNSATEAYFRAYSCSRKAAEANATRLLADERVKEMVAAARQKASAAVGISAEWFAQRIKLEAEGEGEGYTHAGRVAALRLAGMMLGLFTEKHEHSGPGGRAIEYDGKFLSTLTSEDLDAVARILEGSGVVDRVEVYTGAFEKAVARELEAPKLACPESHTSTTAG